MKKWRVPLVGVLVVALSLAFAMSAFATTTVLDMPDGAYQASTTKIDISAIADETSVGSITDGVLAASFTAAPRKKTVGIGWATWGSPPYTEQGPAAAPAVLFSTSPTNTIQLDQPVSTFGFEMEPNPLSVQDFTVVFKLSQGDVLVGTIVKSVDGFGGARLFALRALDDAQCFDKIEIVATSDFAMGQFRYALPPEGAWSISDDLTPQQVCMNLPVAIKVHPTIQMDTDVEYLEYNCANPLTNSTVAFAFDWTVKSNVPWWKRIEASNLALGTYDERSHSWITAPGTGYVFNSLKMGPDGFPVQGEYEEVMLNDVVAADRIKLTITDEDGTVHEGNPWWSEVIGDADTHEDTERVGYEVDFNWCDTAGWYGGYVWLCAFQN